MKMPADKIALRSKEFYDAWDIEVSLSSIVTELDPVSKVISYTASEEVKTVNYDAALVATGASPSRLAFLKGNYPYRKLLT
jgi:NAD(P)H-nitrite reductase large subunit